MPNITMQDIRLVAGEGKLEARHVLDAVNIIIRRKAEMNQSLIAHEFTKWVEGYANKVCPSGCLPTPAQELEVALFARVVIALQERNA